MTKPKNMFEEIIENTNYDYTLLSETEKLPRDRGVYGPQGSTVNPRAATTPSGQKTIERVDQYWEALESTLEKAQEYVTRYIGPKIHEEQAQILSDKIKELQQLSQKYQTDAASSKML
jgi:hypothetical protein